MPYFFVRSPKYTRCSIPHEIPKIQNYLSNPMKLSMNQTVKQSLFRYASISAFMLISWLGNARSSMAYTIHFFPASTYSTDTQAMDLGLGINGFEIEDFEDTTLINGLTISFSGGSGGNQTLSSLFATLGYLQTAWDGSHVVISDPNNATPFNAFGYYPVSTTFNYGPGATSIGIGLSGFQSDINQHLLYINGTEVGTLESLAGADWISSRTSQNVYVRIDADPNEILSSIGFANISVNAIIDDVVAFDHFAVSAVPDSGTTVVLLLLGSGGLFVTMKMKPFLRRI